ncbi:MAG: ATP-binding cassette domain-containing protein [Thiotrichaceae bacterium]
MLVFSDLAIRRGPRQLLSGANFSIHPQQKVGLTGANGTGKSTLFALIMDQLDVDEGSFSMPPGWVIAHVKQETPNTDISALDYTLQGDTEYTQLHQQLESVDDEHLGDIHAQLDAIDGYTAISRASILLHGLGFSNEQIAQPVGTFSGGWRMRLNLAQALMCRSDLLLLDEPTNHLDLDAVIWLQSWLAAYKGTLILISHDREFLDGTVSHIAQIEHEKISLYHGNYSAFEVIRAEQLSQQQSAHEKQQREIGHMQQYVDRFRAQATKAKQAQSRLKALERMQIIAPAHVDSPFSMRFFDPEKLPERLITIKDTTLGYGATVVVDHLKLDLLLGDRVGLIGPNGAGKSTVIKYLAGELKAISEESWQAKDLKIGYFAQHQLDQLDPEQSALEHVRQLDKKAREQDLRNYLGGYGFQGSRVDEPVAPFSGGEKARLALALIVYEKPNLLLLDEPTNHLDLEMRHALTIALQSYKGAIVVVSHDRHLLKTVTDELIMISHGKAETYAGDLDDYAAWIQNKNKQQAEQDNQVNSGFNVDQTTTLSRKEQRKLDAEKRKKLQPLTNKLKRLESKLDKLNKQKEGFEEQLADSSIYQELNKDKLKALLVDKKKVDISLEDVEMEWMEVSEEYEAAIAINT